MADRVAAGQAGGDGADGLCEAETVCRQRVGGGRLHLRKSAAPEDMVGVRGNPFRIVARPAALAVYAVVGIEDIATGTFTPYLMGIRRGLLVGPEEELRSQAPDFWDDAQKAEQHMKNLRELKSWVSGYEEVKASIDDLQVLFDFLESIFHSAN